MILLTRKRGGFSTEKCMNPVVLGGFFYKDFSFLIIFCEKNNTFL